MGKDTRDETKNTKREVITITGAFEEEKENNYCNETYESENR
jgi:hypothetical protein